MAQITISVKRVTSLLKYLRGGRGLGEYKGGMQVILQIWERNAESNLVEILPLMGGRSEVTFDIPKRFYGSPVILFGAELEPNDLFFQLRTTFSISKHGHWLLRTPTGTPGPTRHVKKLTIAFVDDWTNALMRLQQELEADGQDHERLLRNIGFLNLNSFDKAYWQRFFSDPAGGWIGQRLSEFVNIDRIDASVAFKSDRLEVNQTLRKPNGGRFGRAKFDYKYGPARVGAGMVGGGTGQSASAWTWLTGLDVEPLDIKFSRPGLKALSPSNRETLEENFQSQFQQTGGNGLNRAFRAEASSITALWPELKRLSTPGRRSGLTDQLTVFQRRFAHRVRKKVMYPGGRTAWVSVACHRPMHAGAIETVVTDPPMGGLVPSSRRTQKQK
ncbi:MAG: hypothetical protein GY948_06310 [Alphaproteobacteria bacterium]|nr:hypothetical protein [Alphaproteobacteria bacterium]